MYDFLPVAVYNHGLARNRPGATMATCKLGDPNMIWSLCRLMSLCADIFVNIVLPLCIGTFDERDTNHAFPLQFGILTCHHQLL